MLPFRAATLILRMSCELYWLGKAYMEHGDEANARRIFTQLLEHYPYTLYQDEVERLLEKL